MEDRSNRGFFDYESSDTDGDAPVPLSFSTTLRHSVSETGLIDILEACIKYDVATYFFPNAPTASSTWTPTYALGDGLTCVVKRYEVQADIRPDLTQGTAVAIKQYLLHKGTEDLERVTEGTIYNLIKRDVEIMASPRFKDEENIAKLLFVGYTEGSPFPTLGVELALHGTLDYVLRSPGEGLSGDDKINFTIDIGTGLDALHHAGIAHGDLKCENILVCHHETRGIVAKITDFSGSCHVGREDAKPSHFTNLWCPPEVLLHDTNIDWRKADVYTYGLLVASIWMRTPEIWAHELDPSFSTCGTEEFVPSETISEGEKEDERERLKLKVDHAENSLVSLLSKALSERLNSALAPVVLSILKASLASCPWDRFTIREIIDEYFARYQVEPRQKTET
ncbi:kinase-like domain-containing protein [Dactylonectria macrodidyma]|uniref:Kinase-like domain-containing protein n=1 Tax=Dactylonectria macrodidyma TaxID=307937 RepID=A0A9P9D7W4_9HYPO|nr:kinase-like domain-containing protein [Dactylonectria macrodidyma]